MVDTLIIKHLKQIALYLLVNNSTFRLNGSLVQNLIVEKLGKIPKFKPSDVDLNCIFLKYPVEQLIQDVIILLKKLDPNCTINVTVKSSKNNITRFEIYNFQNSNKKIGLDIRRTKCSTEIYNLFGHEIKGISQAECIAKKVSAITEPRYSKFRAKDFASLYEIVSNDVIRIDKITEMRKLFNHPFGSTYDLKRNAMFYKNFILTDENLYKVVKNNSDNFYEATVNFLDVVTDPKPDDYYWSIKSMNKTLNKTKSKSKDFEFTL